MLSVKLEGATLFAMNYSKKICLELKNLLLEGLVNGSLNIEVETMETFLKFP